ncbi:hypothetical protein ACQ4PT_034871 [Festuca glaucescens]
MPLELRERIWNEDPPPYGYFSLEVCHNGFFGGLGERLQYVDDTFSVFDYLSADTWSNLVLDEILQMLGCLRDQKVHVYWLFPGKTLKDGLLPIVTDADMTEMRNATAVDNTQVIFVDHTNFLRTIRAEIVRNNVARPAPSVARPAPSVARLASYGARPAPLVASEATSIVAVENVEQETLLELDDDTDSGSDFDIYDSDYDAEDGDDDLFIDNVDNSVNDNNERVVFVEIEDKDALDDRDLNLVDDERQQLQLKFKEFNPEVDMDSHVFKIGMKFADIEEIRQAVNAYNIKNRVKIRKIKNDRTRVHAICDEGCPWFLKNIFPQTLDPRLDPSNRLDNMVYMMGQEVFVILELFGVLLELFDVLLELFAVLCTKLANDRVYFPRLYIAKKHTAATVAAGRTLIDNLKLLRTYYNWVPNALHMIKRELIDHTGLNSIIYLWIYTLG